jgi:hypothetical protein
MMGYGGKRGLGSVTVAFPRCGRSPGQPVKTLIKTQETIVGTGQTVKELR